MTMNYEILQNFVKDVIEVKGGIAEEKEKGVLDILLPEALQRKLSCREYQQISFLPNHTQGEFVTYGSPFLDKILSLTQDFGKITRVFIKDVYLKKGDLVKLIEEAFEFPNSKRLGHLMDNQVICSYLLINFKANIISDERKEEIITAIVDEQTLREAQEMVGLASFFYPHSEKWPELTIKRQPLKKVYHKAKKVAVKLLNKGLKEIEDRNLRRLKRDIERLWEYYLGLKKELQKRMARGLSSEDKEKIFSKLKLIDIEFDRKRYDLVDKYTLNIKLEPTNACRIYLPKMLTEYQVQRKNLKKTINFFWNPLIKDIEPLICEACGEETHSVYLCNNLHLVCPHCYFHCPRCGKTICKKCFPKKCPNCGLIF